jgi:phosphoglycerate dehydrogenase-like enzyme
VGRPGTGAELGIVGLGRVGSRVARICARGFGMRVRYYDVIRMPAHEAELGVEFLPFDHVLTGVDILTLHVPLTPVTRRMIDAAALERMRRGSYLVNASRGEVVDIDALAAAIGAGHIAGAGIDVFPDEPLRTDHPILGLPTVVASPHMASHSDASLVRMALVTEDVARVLRGETPKFRVA